MTQLINENRSGLKIDGIIQDFLCTSSQIKAGQFVNYVNGLNILKEGTAHDTIGAGNYCHAVKIDETRVFVIHQVSSSTNTTCGTLLKFDTATNTITKLSSQSVIAYDGSIYNAHCTVLDDSRVIVVANDGANWYYLQAVVCTITETSFTVGTNYRVSNKSHSGTNARVARIDTDRALVTFTNKEKNNSIYAIALSIKGSVITVEIAETEICTTPYSNEKMTLVELSTNKVFLAHQTKQTDSTLNAMIVNVGTTNITCGPDTVLSDIDASGEVSCACLMDENKILLIHSYDVSFALAGMICTVEGNTITHGKDVKMANSQHSASNSEVFKIAENKACVLCYNNTNQTICTFICDIDGMGIAPNIMQELESGKGSGYHMTGTLLNQNKIIILHSGRSTTQQLESFVCSMKTEVSTFDSSEKMCGVAVSSATQGQSIKVAVPKL